MGVVELRILLWAALSPTGLATNTPYSYWHTNLSPCIMGATAQ